MALSSLRIRQGISAIRGIDLRTASIDLLRERLDALSIGHRVGMPLFPPNQVFWRAVRWGADQQPTHRCQLTYPLPRYVKSNGRANRAGSPLFYGSSSATGCFYELEIAEGDHVALSKWRTVRPLIFQYIGYGKDSFAALASSREVPSWVTPLTAADQRLRKFLSTEFSKRVSVGDEHLYKLSIAIAESLILSDINVVGRLHVELPAGERPRFAGVLYPSVEMQANSDNGALLPWAADEALQLELTEWIRVESRPDATSLSFTTLDFANSFGANGSIKWKGRLPQVTVQAGVTLTINLEDSRYVVRNQAGAIVEPF